MWGLPDQQTLKAVATDELLAKHVHGMYFVHITWCSDPLLVS
jgi:hypothetical protein